MALKGSKQGLKEYIKESDKKKTLYEKKIHDLTEFKTIKLAEEREEKQRKRKELKKANKQRLNISNLTVNTETKSNDNTEEPVGNGTLDLVNEVAFMENGDINSNLENKEVFEAKLMSNEEKEVFFGKLLEDFKNQLQEVNKPLLENLEKMNFSAGQNT